MLQSAALRAEGQREHPVDGLDAGANEGVVGPEDAMGISKILLGEAKAVLGMEATNTDGLTQSSESVIGVHKVCVRDPNDPVSIVCQFAAVGAWFNIEAMVARDLLHR